MKLLIIVLAIGMLTASRVPASEEAKAILSEFYAEMKPVRILPLDPNNENQVLECEVSNTWVTVFEHFEASKDTKMRVSYALMCLQYEWREARQKHDDEEGEGKEREEGEESKAIYAKMTVLAKYLQGLQAAKRNRGPE